MAGPTSIPPSVAHAIDTAALGQASAPHMFTDMTFSPLTPPANGPGHGGAQIPMQPPPQQYQASDNLTPDMQFGGPADMTGDLLDLHSFDAAADAGMMDLTTGAINNNANNLAGNSDMTHAAVDVDMSNDVDAEIENLLNSAGPNSAENMDMDYNLGAIGLENNSFEDMFFDNASGGDDEFGPNSYYGM